jgi:uncharacterized repeat protein (TIGR01451 family)
MKDKKTKSFSISKKARWSFGGLFLAGVTTLLIATLSLQQPMEVYASIDPGLNSGNATVDRTTVPGETILKYTTTGNSTFAAPAGVTDVRVMVVGGGGGGGADNAGGGGAGGLIEEASHAVTPGANVTVTVGKGGTGPTSAGFGGNGDNSVFDALTAIGGGGGGFHSAPTGQDGGSGGGAGRSGLSTVGVGGSGTAGQGNDGGGTEATTSTGRNGGGGGAGAVGATGTQSGPGVGGDGVSSDITGTATFYAGGGGGSGRNEGGNQVAGAIGGNGGGGQGGGSNGAAIAATANTGGGGGGGSCCSTITPGGAGGSGTVIVRFTTQNLPDPGGVSGTRMWYKADSAGNTNAQWNDVSGFGHNLTQGTAANQPALTTNSLNFNPAYVFDGSSDVFRMNTQGIGANEPVSAFFAAMSTNSAGGWRYINEFGDDAPDFGFNNGKPELYAAGTSPISFTYSTENVGVPHVLSFISPNANNQSRIIGVDDNEQTQNVTSGTYNTGSGRAGTSFGSTNGSSGTGWPGPIAEAIYFNKVLSAQERLRVASYLSIKYGITRYQGAAGAGYSDSGGATIWSADSTYKNNITGIGRDDTSTLNQKQSKSVNSDSLVTIGLGNIAATNQDNANTFGADRSFLMWGNNAASTTATTTVDNTYVRMERIWKAGVINSVGQVKVQIPASAITTGGTPTMYVSDDTTFDGSDQQITMTSNGGNYEADVTFATGTQYFSFGSRTGSDIAGVSKTATDVNGNAITSYTPGQSLKYNLTFENNGPEDAGTVTVTDTLPTGIVPKTNGATGSGWSCNVAGQTVTCTRTSLANGATAPVIEIEANIASSVTGQKVNTASASVADDPDTSNNDVSLTLDAAPQADLSITKAHNGTPTAGDPYNYDFVVTNDGPSDVSTFTVTDTLDSNLTFTSSTAEVSCTVTTNISCDAAAPLASGDTRSFSITVTVDGGFGGGSIFNQATVAVPAGTTDPNTGNNTSNQDETGVTVDTDLTISKTHTGDFTAGENESFTINVTNNGPSDAPSGAITVTDTLDEDFSYVPATGTDWSCSENTGTVSCTYNAILTSTSTSSDITLPVVVDSIADTPTDNIATVSSTTPDSDLTNNSSTDTVNIVAEADLAITKDHVGTAFTPGQDGQYTFSVVNNGPSADSPSYQITDTLPAGLTYVSYSGDSDCSTSSGTNVVCNGGAVGVGDSAHVTTITVAVDPSATGTFDNTATVVVASGVTDPTPGNNSDDNTVTIEPNADLSIAKTPPSGMTAGDNADYTFTTTNDGPSDVSSYTVTDTLDPNLTFVSSTPGGACTVTGTSSQGGQIITCDGGAITGDGSTGVMTATVTVQQTATAGSTIDNSAEVATPAGVNDIDTSNNTSAVVSNTVDANADLAITKATSATYTVGQDGTFDFQVTNNGPSDASTATITDTLPDGLTYKDVTTNSGPSVSCNSAGQTVTCGIGPGIGSGETSDFTMGVTVNPDATAGSKNNSASVSSATPDPDTSNNDTGNVPFTVDAAEADLAATKTLQGTMTAGQSATYRFEITNNGPDNAGTVTISDTLESYLSYQNFSSVSGGTWDCSASGQDVTCTLPVLNNGDTAVVDVTVLVAQDAPDTADNSALVTFNGTDSSANNPATTGDPIAHEADLDLQLAFDSETYQSGDTVTLTYTVINHGPSAAEDVVLTDTLPDGLTFENIIAVNQSPTNSSLLAKVADTVLGSSTASAAPNTPFDCSNSGQDISCSANTVFTGTYTITLTAHISDSFTGELTSVAQLTSATFDPDGATASATATANVVAASGLAGTGQNILTWLVSGILLAGTGGFLVWRKRHHAVS